LDSFSATQLERFEALLGENDVDLLAWVMGQTAPPAAHDNDVFELILDFRNGISKL
jgi:succinate dehydrogenase flavin-adding protein (antitoxin of CptAB toxin-antitoxin module)